MPNQDRNGRNVAMPDENQPSWRPQDDQHRNRRNMSDDDRNRDRDWGRNRWMGEDEDARSDRYSSEHERYGSERYGSERYGNERYGNERYGQGQSGYGAGRIEGDRSYGSRNQANMSDWQHDRGGDDRFGGRGGQMWNPDDRGDRGMYGSSGNYGHTGHWTDDTGGGWLGQSGQQMGYQDPPHLGRPYGQRMSGYGYQREHDMRFRGGEQRRYDQQIYGQRGMHRGKGPAGYTRSDDRIREMVCDVLTDHDAIDASNIEVSVKAGEVTLTGTVEDRLTKRMAEDVIENLSGVKEVSNQLRVSDKRTGSAVEHSGREQSMQSGTHSGNGGSDKRHRA